MKAIWDGIEDVSNEPRRVWFSKGSKDSDPWLPLRKCDCQSLNEFSSLQIEKQIERDFKVFIESGRATADLRNHEIKSNLYPSQPRRLGSAVWFKKEAGSSSSNTSSSNDGKKEKHNLVPIISSTDEAIVENLYKEALQCQSSKMNKDALEYVLKKEIPLKDDSSYKVYIALSNGGTLTMRKRKQHFISLEGFSELQRGYGDYNVDGELIECSLGPVSHVSFIIHGIGEAMWSKEEVQSTSLIDEINSLRSHINKKMYIDWKLACEKSKGKPPPPPNRIEFIPIQWYAQIHSSSSSLKKDLISTTLTSVPKLRSIANDVLFDVLVYNTPEFCQKVINVVTDQICDVYEIIQHIHEGFLDRGGSFSIVGHSLGAVIAWDILSILSDNLGKGEGDQIKAMDDDIVVSGYSLPSQNGDSATGYEAYLTQTESNIDQFQAGTWGPSLPRRMTKTIPFVPSFTFFLGSPIGLFLTLRGARPHFTAMISNGDMQNKDSDITAKIHQSSPFHLPSGSVYNIFSPSDPVAYRIEPLLTPPDFPDQELPSPCFLTPGGKGLRFHVKAKEFGDSILKSFSGIMTTTLDKIPDKIAAGADLIAKDSKQKGKWKWNFALGGKSERVDYQLQPGVVENEYLAAISAHNAYLRNDDLLQFWIESTQLPIFTSVISCD